MRAYEISWALLFSGKPLHSETAVCNLAVIIVFILLVFPAVVKRALPFKRKKAVLRAEKMGQICRWCTFITFWMVVEFPIS
jgi:hypothetical protein